VLILCPGWRKAQLVFEVLKKYSTCSRPLRPMLIILGKKKEEAETVKIQGCKNIFFFIFLMMLENNVGCLNVRKL